MSLSVRRLATLLPLRPGPRDPEPRAERPPRPTIHIDPSGRPTERAGFEALYALGLITVWMVLMGAILSTVRGDVVGVGPWPSIALAAVALGCWRFAMHVVDERGLIWPGSALGLLGPLSLGFAVGLSTPELRLADHFERLAVVTLVAGPAMIPFLFRFRLPGLVSPIMTFTLVGVFLTLYGTDMERIRQMEGFSPRGIVAALMDQPLVVALFGVLGLAGVVAARRLDGGDNFGLAAARPLHLVATGVFVLVLGRLFGQFPAGWDLATLAALWLACSAWALRVNRIAVVFATHFAMAKPLTMAAAALLGIEIDLRTWVLILTWMLFFDLFTWPFLHLASQRLGWTCGPGYRRPPERPGAIWRYWPYAR